MKTSKRVLSLVLMLLLVMSIAVPAFAEVTPNTGTQIQYLSRKVADGNYSYIWIDLASGYESFTIKRSSVKVADAGTTKATVYSFEKRTSQYDYKWNDAWEDGNPNYSYEAGIRVGAAGTATISYKIGTTTYKTKVKVLNYVNPIKSVTLTGVNSGKSFAAKTKNQSYMDTSKALALNAKTKSAKLAVKPIDGWKLRYVTLTDVTTGLSREIYNNKTGMTSATINWGTLSVGHNYRISVTCVNTKNDATQSITYYIHGASADNNYNSYY